MSKSGVLIVVSCFVIFISGCTQEIIPVQSLSISSLAENGLVVSPVIESELDILLQLGLPLSREITRYSYGDEPGTTNKYYIVYEYDGLRVLIYQTDNDYQDNVISYRLHNTTVSSNDYLRGYGLRIGMTEGEVKQVLCDYGHVSYHEPDDFNDQCRYVYFPQGPGDSEGGGTRITFYFTEEKTLSMVKWHVYVIW